MSKELSTVQKAAIRLASGDVELAESLLKFSLIYSGESWEAFTNLGIIEIKKGNINNGIKNYKKAIRINNNIAEIHYNLSIAYEAHNDIKKAIASAEEAFRLNDKSIIYSENLAKLHALDKNFEKAIELIEMTLSYNNDDTGLLITYAGILIEDEQYEKAEIVLKKASISSSIPDQTEKILRNILILQFQNGAYNDAELTIREIRKKFPNSERVDTLEYMLYLIKKDFLKGWILHERRDVRRPSWCLGKPEYNLESDGTVFVSSEQGIGDELMFSTVLPDLILHANKVILECDKRLHNLYSRSFGTNVKLVCNGDELKDDEYDYQIRLGSLPKFFRKTEESFERCSKGILQCDDSLANTLREQIKLQFDKPIVGLSWKSELNRRLNRGNSMKLKELLKSLEDINAVFINLQYGDVKDEIKEASEGLDIDILYDDSIDYKNDIDSLAALIKACDYVITTPNVTVSLSGNLGVKTYYLMPKAGDRWKWGMDEKKCYWFNSVEIFRQKKLNDWDSAILPLLRQLNIM